MEDDNERKYRPIVTTVVVNAENNRRLTEAARAAGRSKRFEAMLRMAHSLKYVPEITESYWELISKK